MYLSVTSKAIKKATMCEILLYFVLYSTRPRVGISTRKNMFTANQYGFLGHEYSLFNLIASSLFALINASKIFFVLWPQCAEGLTPPLLQTPPPPLYGHPQDFFYNITPMKHRINRKINSCGKVMSSFLNTEKLYYMLFI